MTVMDMDQSTLRRMQMIELELLLEIDRICRKYEIKYNICGGTLIGAVRHKGFIPWDDDIDIRMLRSEYRRFKKACRKELDPKKFFLQDFSTDKKYRWGYAKMLRADTVYIRSGQEHLGIRNGVFLDIFITDGIPNSRYMKKIHNAVCFAVRKILWSPVGARISPTRGLRLWYCLLAWIPRWIPIAIIHFMAFKWNADKCSHFRALTFPQKRGLKKEWFTELTELEFEGHMVYVPADYKGWLTQEYGNYMKMPPEEKRISHSTASYYKF